MAAGPPFCLFKKSGARAIVEVKFAGDLPEHDDLCRALVSEEAKALFSGQPGCLVTPTDVIKHIDAFLARQLESGVMEVNQHSRRQAIIDSLLAKANKAAHKARRVATALVGALF